MPSAPFVDPIDSYKKGSELPHARPAFHNGSSPLLGGVQYLETRNDVNAGTVALVLALIQGHVSIHAGSDLTVHGCVERPPGMLELLVELIVVIQVLSSAVERICPCMIPLSRDRVLIASKGVSIFVAIRSPGNLTT